MAVEKKTKAKTKEAPEKEQLTYEQLEQIAANLSQENRAIRGRLGEAMQYIQGINEVGVLLSILGKAEYFDSSFIDGCSKRIQETIVSSWKEPEEGDNAEA